MIWLSFADLPAQSVLKPLGQITVTFIPKCATSFAKGDLSKAEEFFGKAAGTSGNLSQALGSISTVKGDYSKAANYFGSTATNNAALVQILNADYKGASKTLAAVAQPNGRTAYLAAIVSARTNDREGVVSNLKSAIKQDGSLAAKAVKDIEFSKYVAEEAFLSVVK